MPGRYLKAAMLIALVVGSSAVSADDAEEFGKGRMKEVTDTCLRYGHIVAEARLNKWKKEGKDVQKAFGSADPYTVVSKIQQQQCVSVQVIQMMQGLKSVSRTKDAAALKIDEEIDRHMAIIEKTL